MGSVLTRVWAFFQSQVPWVILSTGATAVLVVFALSDPSQTPASNLGLAATLWALLLAVAIYMITSGDRDKIIKQVHEAYSTLLDEKQAAEDLNRNKATYKGWIDALEGDGIRVPWDDITSVRTVGSRNPNVLIGTRRGRNYQVYKGGRNGGYTVTHLPNSQDV